jgi:hypothetical protein
MPEIASLEDLKAARKEGVREGTGTLLKIDTYLFQVTNL